MFEASKLLVCPSGDPNRTSLKFEMAEVLQVEARINEVAYVTPEKAPELLSTFNRTFLDLTRKISLVELERQKAVREANKRKSVVILDEAPRILREKNLTKDSNPAGSADLREAVLNNDDPYLNLLERVDQISAIHELLRGKLKAIEMAYTSVKKILGESAFNYNTHNTSAPDEISGEAGTTDSSLNSLFGKTSTRY